MAQAARLRQRADASKTEGLQRQMPGTAAPAGAPVGAPAAAAGGPVVNVVDPPSGSLCGGTKLTLSGAGFSPTPEENQVLLQDTPCEVVAATPTELRCVTPATAAAGLTDHDHEVPLHVRV